MSARDERAANAVRVLVGEPVQPIPARWWHAYGRVREFPREDGTPPAVVHQLTVIGPVRCSARCSARELGDKKWGKYLTSWDHQPSNREKAAVTPEEFREAEDELALWDALDEARDPDDDGEW